MWKTVKLGDVCKIVNGSTPSRREDDYWGGEINWFTIDDMRREGRDIYSTAQKVTQKALKETSLKILPANTVLLCCTASVGEVAISRVEMATNQQFNGLIPNTSLVLADFLYYVASTLKGKLLSVSGSTTINFVSIGKLKDILVNIPPLAEQQKIVEKLDTAFEEIDRAIEATERKQEEVSALKSAVLSREFSPSEFRKRAKVGEVLELIQNGINCDQDKSGSGVKITRIETIADAKINYEKTGFATLNEAQKAKAKLEKGDILFSHINSAAHVGKTAVYNSDEELFHGINLLRMRTIAEVDSNYFNYFLKTLFWSGYWRKACKQSVNQASVNQADIKAVEFSYPPLAEQQQFVEKLDRVFMAADEASQSFTNQLDQYKQIKSAILAQELKGPES